MYIEVPFDINKQYVYEVASWYAKNFSGLEDSLTTYDRSEMQDFVHEKCMNGLHVTVLRRSSDPDEIIPTFRIRPDIYIEDFNGEFPYSNI